MLLTGVWLFVGFWMISYPVEYRAPHLIETGAAIIVVITAIVRLSRPRGLRSDLLVAVVGVGLLVAALLGTYEGGDTDVVIRVNQAASGAVLLLLAVASALLLRPSGASERHGPGDERPPDH
ncbi:hypothetical protein ACIQ6R_35245 [Streptomyces sp. NPDC096048]|uniref:hypothetical protein n=1 Tax=Streptomyces sp. NPDC096048 TaxID=3366072 RepID=UPI0038273847